MKLLSLVIFLLHAGTVVSQTDFSRVKAQIINEIVQKVSGREKDSKLLVIADVASRTVITSTGVGGTYIKYQDEKLDDSAAIKKLRDSFFISMGKLFMFKTFKEVVFNNRNEVINSYLFKGRDIPKKYAYIEIAAPIDGWEIGEFFISDKTFFNEDRYMRFQKPRFCIPVYVWKSDDNAGKEESQALLFRYDLIFSNGTLVVKLIEMKEI